MSGLNDGREAFYDVLFSTLLANGFACPASAIQRCVRLLRLPAGLTGTPTEIADELRRRVARGELGIDRPERGEPHYFLVDSADSTDSSEGLGA